MEVGGITHQRKGRYSLGTSKPNPELSFSLLLLSGHELWEDQFLYLRNSGPCIYTIYIYKLQFYIINIEYKYVQFDKISI